MASLTGSVGKVYDATTAANLIAGNYQLAGALGLDSVSLNNPTLGSFDTRNVGSDKTVTFSGLTLSGVDAGNYMLTASTVSGAVGSIRPAQLTLTVEDMFRMRSQPDPAFTYMAEGLMPGDSAASIQGLSFTATAGVNAEPGFYEIIASGGSAANDEIVYMPGQLRVVPDVPPSDRNIRQVAQAAFDQLTKIEKANTAAFTGCAAAADMASQWTGEITAAVDWLSSGEGCNTPDISVEGFPEPMERRIEYNLSATID